jgi:hypothetical protein
MNGDLRQLLPSLASRLREVEFDAFVKLGQGPIPDQILVALDPDGEGRVLHLQLLFLPELDDPPVLQYYVGLPYAIGPAVSGDLCRFLCAVNPSLPVTGFEYHEASSLLFFRHTHCVGVEPLDPDVVAWTVTTIEFLVGHFGPLCEEVAGGLASDEACVRLVDDLASLVTTS